MKPFSSNSRWADDACPLACNTYNRVVWLRDVCRQPAAAVHFGSRPARFRRRTYCQSARIFHVSPEAVQFAAVDTFGIDASAITDASGNFSVSAQLNDRVRVIVQEDQFIGDFQLPPFPPSNRMESVVWKLSRHKPPVPQ